MKWLVTFGHTDARQAPPQQTLHHQIVFEDPKATDADKLPETLQKLVDAYSEFNQRMGPRDREEFIAVNLMLDNVKTVTAEELKAIYDDICSDFAAELG